ncbi:hypothetical protein PR048_011561, partial [Dryococelus australis]
MATVCLTVLKNYTSLESLHHKFLVPGHMHIECAIDNTMIERRKKKSGFPIYYPHDWKQFVCLTGKKIPLKSLPMYYTDYFLQYRDLHKNTLQMKKESLNCESEFKKMTEWCRGQAQNNLIPKPCYSGKQPITRKKRKDLLDLLPFIPSTFHEFYKGLPTSSDASADIHPDTIEYYVEYKEN